MATQRWFVAQIGAREHYAVPRAIHRRGQLATLYTEAWLPGGHHFQAWPEPVRSLAGRFHSELASAEVVSFTLRALFGQAWRAGRHPRTLERQFRCYTDAGRTFARRVERQLRHQTMNPAADVYFGYDTGCLETLDRLRRDGIFTIVDQIDPARTEEELVYEESKKWPGWQAMTGRVPSFYYERLAREWDLASIVVVNSAWSKTALIQQGVPAAKIEIVPLAYELPAEPPRERRRAGPLKVLWLGSVILRKGIQYLLEAARLLQGSSVQIIVAGPVHIAATAVASAPSNVSFVGRVSRDRAADYYRAADVFVLPTISDGFAITQLEAMAHGVPVIATPHCGEVVNDGEDGFIIPPFSGQALAAAILDLDRDPERAAEMSRRAVAKSRRFSIAHLGQSLCRIVDLHR